MRAEAAPFLTGRVAIVTGGNSGIGLGIAQALAAAGAMVAISGRRESENEAATAAIAAGGGQVIAIRADVSVENEVEALVAEAEDRLGPVDICVANAGGAGGGTAPLVEMDSAMWRSAMALNLDGPFYLYRAVARRMIAAGRGGALIGISSVASIRAAPSLHYAAAKGALNAMTMNLAAQLGPQGIRVNAILPGMIETPATDAILSSERMRSGILRRIPVGRVGTPADIAELSCYLASDRASFVTGQCFVVDGGMSIT